MKVLLTTRQLAKKLQMHMVTLCVWRREGKGPPFVKIGNSVRYEEDKVDEWIEQQAAKQECAEA